MKKRASRKRAPRISAPPHPHRRREPLPHQEPKSERLDADAPRRIRAILDSPSYLPAENDSAFLDLGDNRGVRLQIEYQKPEYVLQRHGIQHTIVVFGSTRITERAAADARVAEMERRLARRPRDRGTRRRLAIARRALRNSRYYDIAREFGRLVGEAGRNLGDGQLVVMTGGGPGCMEAANRGAFDAGSETVGLNIALPLEQYPNPYITPELCFQFHYFALRKMHLLLRARALVVFPGGYGTLDELFETLTLVQTRKIAPIPVVLVGESYWRRAIDIDFLVDEGTVDAEDRELFWYAETAEEIWEGILRWHETNGTPLLQR